MACRAPCRCPSRAYKRGPCQRCIEGRESRANRSSSEAIGAGAGGMARGGRDASRWCRRWARSTPGIWRWSTEAQAARRPGGGDDLRQSAAVRRRTRTSTRYPRQEADDVAMLEAAGCDLLWLPTADELYPDGLRDHGQRRRGQRALGRRGAAGAFRRRRDGGRQAVHRGAARPRAVRRKGFPAAGGDPADGRATLGLAIEIVGVPTVRDADGLALSSRNAYLSDDERQPRAGAAASARSGARRDPGRASRSRPALDAAKAQLGEAGFAPIDYVALVDAATLEPLDSAGGRDAADRRGARSATTRLIDNIRVVSDTVQRQGHRGVNHLFAIRAETSVHRTWNRGRDMAISQKSADFLLSSRLADAEAGRCRCLVRAGRDLFDRARRRSRST